METYHRLLNRFPVFAQLGIVFQGESAPRVKEALETIGFHSDLMYFNPNAGEVGAVLKVYLLPSQPALNTLLFNPTAVQETAEIIGTRPHRYEWDFLRQKRSGLEIACSREDDHLIGVSEKWGFGRRHPKRSKSLPDTSGRMVDYPPDTPLVSHETGEPYIWKGFTPLYLWTRQETAASQKVRSSVRVQKDILQRAGRLDRLVMPRPEYEEVYWRVITKWSQEGVMLLAEAVDSEGVPMQLRSVPDSVSAA